MAEADKKSTRRPRGPREEPGVMVERIIAAARASFGHNGWAGTTMRAIAREVDVDPALVHYYFASKEDLLDAATMPPEEWLEVISRTSSVPARERGEAMVRNLIWSWAQPAIRDVLSSILMTAAHEPRTREKLKAFLTASLLPAIADRIEGEERLLRASLTASQVGGAIGIAVIGSILTSTYSGHVDVTGLSSRVAAKVKGSFAIAAHLQPPIPDRAHAAFVIAMNIALLTAVGAALIAAVTVAVLLRTRHRSAHAAAPAAAPAAGLRGQPVASRSTAASRATAAVNACSGGFA